MSTFAILLLGMAAIGTLFNLAAAALVRPVRATRLRDQWPSVTVLKPLHGMEPALEHNLETVFTQAYPGSVQIVFGTSSASDPAIALAAQVRVPTLIPWGDRDKNKPRAEADELQSMIRGSRLVRFAAAGHYVHEEAPDGVARAIKNWLAGR